MALLQYRHLVVRQLPLAYKMTPSRSFSPAVTQKVLDLPPNLKIHPQSTDSMQPVRRRSMSTAVSQKVMDLPPNLKIDPRSTCAPRIIQPVLLPKDDEKVEDDDDEVQEEVLEDDLFDSIDDVFYATPLPERLHVDIFNSAKEQTGTIWLSDKIWGMDPIRVDLIQRNVLHIRNKMRGRRKAITKTISEVSGSGRKVRPQKGQGMARAGHSRPAHWRGGAKAHGPKGSIQNYANCKINKKVKRLAIKHCLSQKLKEGNVILIDKFDLPNHKTKELAKLLDAWSVAGRHGTNALIVDHLEPENSDDQFATTNNVPIHLMVASRNLYKIKVMNQLHVNVYDLLKYEKLFLTLPALTAMEERMAKYD